jgi:hypothetical protein
MKHLTHDTVYVNWSLKELHKGKKGAYGQTTQNNIIVINTNHFQPGIYNTQTADVNVVINKNEYWLCVNNKYVRFKNKESLIKLFPEKKTLIQNLIRQKNLSFSNPKDVFILIEDLSSNTANP